MTNSEEKFECSKEDLREVAEAVGRLTVVLSGFFEKLLHWLEHIAGLVEELHEREAAKPDIQSGARYHLDRAAKYLEVSPCTLKRRANEGKFVIRYDGKTPFVMGAEIIRYAQKGAIRKR